MIFSYSFLLLKFEVDSEKDGAGTWIVAQVNALRPAAATTVADLRIHSGVRSECKEILSCHIDTASLERELLERLGNVVAEGYVLHLEIVPIFYVKRRDPVPVAV